MFRFSKNGISVFAVLDRRRLKNSGLYPVKIEVIYRRQQKFFAAGVDMSAEDWERKCSDGSIDKDSRIKKRFHQVVRNVETLVVAGRFSLQRLTLSLDNNAGKQAVSVNEIMERMGNDFLRVGKINSYYRCRSALRSIERYSGRNISPDEVDLNWLEGCETFWLKEGKSATTVGVYMKTLKSAMYIAVGKGVYSIEDFPFGKNKYAIPQGNVRKLALTKDQIRKVIEYKGSANYERHRDLWLFSYMCNGINFKDMLLLKYRNITNDEICFVRSKTKSSYGTAKTVRAVLTPEMRTIIGKWGNTYTGDPETYVFPYAEGLQSEISISNMVRNVISSCNASLKHIAEKQQIPKFTTYSARHSFATVLMKSGVNIKFISESLGHSSLSVTETYLSGFDYEERLENISFLTRF